MIRMKYSAWRSCIASGFNTVKLELFKSVRNKCNKLIKKVIKQYKLKIAKLSKSFPKFVFKYMIRNSNHKPSIKAIKTDDMEFSTPDPFSAPLTIIFKNSVGPDDQPN